MEIKYSYKPVPTLREFADCNAFLRAVVGPIGSGKSSACVIECLTRALAQKPGPDGVRRTRWIVVRQTYPQLRDTTVKTFFQWAPPHQFGTYKQSENIYTIEAFENTHIEVLFRALDRNDHVSNLLSLEITGGWLNEVKDINWAIVEALQGRVGRYPSKIEGGPTWHGVWMDTNPPDTDSKFYKFWEETQHNPQFAKIFHQPSGLSPQAENMTNLPPHYYRNVSLGKDPEYIKVYVEGKYGFVRDGMQVFPEYNDAAHSNETIKPVSYEPIIRGWDFGLTPSCVFGQMTPNGQLIVFDEMVSDSMGIDQFSDEVLEHCTRTYPNFTWEDVGDPAGTQRSQTDEKTCFQILTTKNILIEPGMQSMAIRLESVRKPLTRLVAGKPAFQIHPRCKMLRKGFMGGYQFRRLQTSTERFTAVPDKNAYSHPHDALQYLCTKLFGGGLTMPMGTIYKDAPAFEEFQRSEITGY